MTELLLKPSGREVGIEAEAEAGMRLPPITGADQVLTRQIPNKNEPGPDQPVDGLADRGAGPAGLAFELEVGEPIGFFSGPIAHNPAAGLSDDDAEQAPTDRKKDSSRIHLVLALNITSARSRHFSAATNPPVLLTSSSSVVAAVSA